MRVLTSALSFVSTRLLSHLPLGWLDVTMFRALLRTKFAALRRSAPVGSRQDAWDLAIRTVSGGEPAARKILVLEFGVYKGGSIRYFASKLSHPESRFVGFDSFEGLPEEWSGKAAGAYSRDGQIPTMNDPRITLVKGWFQATLPAYPIDPSKFDAVFVHLDADIYSSTLFVLAQLWGRVESFHALFDEFMNDETRALYNFSQAFPSNIEFLAHDNAANPARVLCKISRAAIGA